MNEPIIRPIEKSDNLFVKSVVQSVFIELDAPKIGTAYEDPSLDCMFETYKKNRTAYFVVEEAGKIIGCAGIAPLDDYDGNICELQKMYFLPEARGRGLGAAMMELCLTTAVAYNYDQCYLETFGFMKAAQKLYQRVGFRYLEKSLGNTGHYSCPVHMLKDL
ncbi:MAG: putative acetyltransferase [Candidatus Latescibacterota bacterium]|jgi:putative acetyltransferase